MINNRQMPDANGRRMIWVNFLHCYLAPSIEKNIVAQVTRESYRKIVSTLKAYPALRLTINMNSCLTEMLAQNGYHRLLNDMRILLEKGQIELVDSAAYHPILPLIPEKEAIKQIKENKEVNKKYFGPSYGPTGFFLPELCYSPRIAKLLDQMEYQWILLDEISMDGRLNQADSQTKYKIKNTGLTAVFRNRKASKSYVPYTVHSMLKKKEFPETLITATDGELYGHRHDDRKKTFQKIINNKLVRTKTVSEYLRSLKKEKVVAPISSNWESLEKELINKIPYALWNHPKNTIQKKLWQLANLAIRLVSQKNKDPNVYWADWHLKRGLASCTFWWASGRDFRLFGPPAWKPDEIEKGANELIKSIRSLETLDNERKIFAEKIYSQIKKMTWSRHWKKFN